MKYIKTHVPSKYIRQVLHDSEKLRLRVEGEYVWFPDPDDINPYIEEFLANNHTILYEIKKKPKMMGFAIAQVLKLNKWLHPEKIRLKLEKLIKEKI